MLVLTRKVGEEIVIGKNIIVRVMSVRGENIRIGVKAPKQTSVNRREVDDLIRYNNQKPTYSE